jgi:hypothetical protein
VSISGKHIACKIGSSSPLLVPGVQQWSAEDSAQELDATTAEDGGFSRPDDGLASLSVSMTLVIDITAGNLTTIQRGTTINFLKLYAHIDSPTPIYTIPVFKVFKSTPKGEINGRFTYDVSGKAVGAYVLADPTPTP